MVNKMYDEGQFVLDIAKANACMTSGLEDAWPEEADFETARKMVAVYKTEMENDNG